MADIKNIDVFQTVTSVSFEVEPNTNIININKVTIEGTGGGSQDLQSVTDIGAITTNSITVDSLGYYSLVSPDAVGTEDKTTGSYAFLGAAGLLGLKNGAVDSILKNTNVTNNNVVLEFPDKPTGSYTIATTLDITTPSLQQVLDYNHNLIDGKNFQGIAAGAFATNANESNLFGTAAGYEATNADYSNFLGQNSGYQATNASSSNFFGFSAGREATYAGSSNFFGVNTGEGATSASNSNFFGANTGRGAIDANNSNFIGQQAGQGAIDANNSNFIGENAGTGATNANNSNFFGYSAGNGATDAQFSNFLGYRAGYQAINALFSNFIGRFAGDSATDASYSNFLGVEAGNGATDASYSNLFGYQAGRYFTDNNIGSNNIIIGTNISLPDATTNSINLGGVLFGTGINSVTDGDPSIVPTPGGKIGIGVVNPTNTLHIYSEAANTSGLRLERLTSASPTSTGQAIGVDASGNVVTVTGGGGSQNLQSVLDIGSTANNVNVFLSSEVGNTLTLAGGAGGSGTLLAYGTEENGTAIKAIGYDGIAINAQGGLGLALYAASIDESLTTDKNVDVANFVNNTLREEDLLYDCSAINVNTLDADGIRVYTNRGIGTTINQGASGKGLVINSGTSSTGVPLTINKNGVDKLVVNQAGELTATKLIKEGGTSSQILAADGSVITAGNNITITGGQISSIGGAGGGGSSVNYYLNGGTSQGTFGGSTYYEFSKTAVIGTGADFNISSNGYIASFITDVADPSLLLIPAGNWNLEFFFSSSSAGGSPSFYVELYKYDGTTFTLITSSSANPEGITGGTAIDAYFTPLAVPETILTVNDRLAIRVFVNASSKTITLHTQNGHLCEVITTFTAGLTALNGLQTQVQNFATGTTGTDFAINSSGSTHTFNLPSASATARGVVTTGSQTFAGDKTFTGTIGASNLSGTNTGDNATNTQYSGLATSKQDTLQNTINIKSINGTTILGSGNLTISASPASQSAYTILANNTNASAVPTEQVYKDIAEQTYSLSPTFTITAPTTIVANTYKWNQVGSSVNVRVNLSYTTAGSFTTVVIPLPTDMPTPLSPTGFTAASDILYYGTGTFTATTSTTTNVGRVTFLRRNAANNGYEFAIIHSSAVAARVVSLTLQYFT